jgi:uncharacterized protein YndB with AHSA1/START domain
MGSMATLTRSITVEAPVEAAFDYALDISRLWSTVPDIVFAEVTRTPEGVGSTARIWSHFLGFHVEATVEYTEVVRPERIVFHTSWVVEHPTWTYTFEPVEGGTKVTATGEWKVKAPVVGGPFEKMMVKEHEPFVDAMLAKLKEELERAGPAA